MPNQDPFAGMSPLQKASLLLHGAKLRYWDHFSAANEHGAYPEHIKNLLTSDKPELGFIRKDRTPLDAAINYGGAYDWGRRPDVSPQDARDMAKAYQLWGYVNPMDSARKPDAVADYYDNLAGVNAGVAARAHPITEEQVVNEAAQYGQSHATAAPAYRKGGRVTPMVPPRTTEFSPHLEGLYQLWTTTDHAPQSNDYDMRGYFLDRLLGAAPPTEINTADLSPHYPDTYKLPNHPSFSNESKYSTGKDDPHWIENPPPYREGTYKLQGTDVMEMPLHFDKGGEVKDKLKDFYDKWKESVTGMFGDYPMPLESSTYYKDTTPSPRMGPEGTTVYSKSHYAEGGSVEYDLPSAMEGVELRYAPSEERRAPQQEQTEPQQDLLNEILQRLRFDASGSSNKYARGIGGSLSYTQPLDEHNYLTIGASGHAYKGDGWSDRGIDSGNVRYTHKFAEGGRVNFDTGGLNYPDYSTRTNPIEVTAPMPTQAEKDAYFATHDAEGNLLEHNPYSLSKLGVGGIEALMGMGSGMAAYIPAAIYQSEHKDSPEATRLADEFISKYTYQPRTQAGRSMLEGVGSAFEASKLPMVGVPELAALGHTRPMLTRNDIRVLGGRGQQLAGDIRDIPTDYANAQYGITKDRPTPGATLQSLAEGYANREASRPSLMSRLTVEPKANIISSGNIQLAQARHPVTGSLVKGTGYSDIGSLMPNAETSGKVNIDDFMNNYIQGGGDAADVLWNQHQKDYAKAMFPDAPNESSALGALGVRYARDTDKLNHDIAVSFSRTPEAQAMGIPAYPEEMQARRELAHKAVPNAMIKYIEKKLGSEKDRMLELAQQGITFQDPKTLRSESASFNAALAHARDKAGFPATGVVAPKLEAAQQAAAEAGAAIVPLIEARDRTHQEWQDMNDQLTASGQPTVVDTAYEPYKQALNALKEHQKLKQKLERNVQNLETGVAYENTADTALLRSSTGLEMKHMPYEYQQFFPGLEKTPDTAVLHDIYQSEATVLNLKNAARDYARAIMHKGLNPATTSIEAFMEKGARELNAKEIAKQKAAEAETNKFTEFLQQRLMQIPKDKQFGNTSAIELTKDTPREQIMQDLSTDTEVLDHCVGQGGRTDRRNRYTGRVRQYEPMVDPITGVASKDSHGEPTSYVHGIESGDIITSLRERTEGKPVATLQLIKQRDGNYELNYVSGFQNETVDPQYADAIAQYLNTKADVLTKEHNRRLSESGVYDLESSMTNREKGNTGLTTDELHEAAQTLPRYVTRNDLVAWHKEHTPAALPATTGDTLESLMTAQENLDMEHQLAIDEGAPDDVLHDIAQRQADVTHRLNTHPDTLRANIPEERITQLMRHMSPEQVRQIMEDDVVARGYSLERATRTTDYYMADHYNDADLADPQRFAVVRRHLRANLPAEAPAPAAAPAITDADVTNYIQNMDAEDVLNHLEDHARDNLTVEDPANWAVNTLQNNDPVQIQSLRDAVRTTLEDNAELVRNAEGWVPEPEPAPMGLPDQSMENALAHISSMTTPTEELRALQQEVEHPTHEGTHWVGNASTRQLDTLRRAIRQELAARMPAEEPMVDIFARPTEIAEEPYRTLLSHITDGGTSLDNLNRMQEAVANPARGEAHWSVLASPEQRVEISRALHDAIAERTRGAQGAPAVELPIGLERGLSMLEQNHANMTDAEVADQLTALHNMGQLFDDQHTAVHNRERAIGDQRSPGYRAGQGQQIRGFINDPATVVLSAQSAPHNMQLDRLQHYMREYGTRYAPEERTAILNAIDDRRHQFRP